MGAEDNRIKEEEGLEEKLLAHSMVSPEILADLAAKYDPMGNRVLGETYRVLP